jgi:hypothetical protein
MRRCLAVLVVCLLPAVAEAQQWTPIGKTLKDSSALFVRKSSIKRAGDSVTALVLTRIASPSYDPVRRDTIRAITILATFKCREEKVVVKETIYYANFDKGRVLDRRKPKIPGYQPVFGAAFPIVERYLCAPPK